MSFLMMEVLYFLCRIIIAYLQTFYRFLIPRYPKNVEGKVILITGAGHGIGRETALGFARLGARLVLWDINKTENEETAEDARKLGSGACAYTVDISKRIAVYATAEKVQDEVGDVDIIINNAGILVGEELMDLDDEQIEQTFNINVLAHIWIIRAFLPHMLDYNDGHIVTVASMVGYIGWHHLVDYSASKFATVGLDDALKNELQVLNKTGIHLSLVCPSFVSTGFIHSVTQRFGKMVTAEDVADSIIYGVQHNQRYIYPKSCFLSRLVIILKAILPYRVMEVIEELPAMRIGSYNNKAY